MTFMEMLKIKNLTHDFVDEEEGTTLRAVDNVSLDVEKGQFIAVLGHNGSGKSTLAKHINAILQPTDGVVYVEGIDTSNDEMVFEIRQRVGMVFQNPDNQLVATVVEEDVAFGLENLGVKPGEIRTRVDEALKDVGMYEFREHAPHQLSGGQKQRIAIAGILAMKPKCIVLDEPTAMLDPQGRREVIKTIRRLNREHNTTVVYITHFMDEAVLADRVIVIDNGRVLMDNIPREVFRHVEELKAVGLDVPQVTELAYKLRKSGVSVPDDILTVPDFVSAFQKIMEA